MTDVNATPAHSRIQPTAARAFAEHVVRRLREAGFEALWAGGCVRDQLLGCTPKDYDVATSATPPEVRRTFGERKTIPVGAAFGVITVLGPREAGQIEVATFRTDGAYVDGRHPESVRFATAEEDALRRDFTINGMFYDPLQQCVLDYVGGQADLQNRALRAIGDPQERFAEDKLRMLRAVRFASALDFTIEPATMNAIRHSAGELAVVSAERIAAELRRMLVSVNRCAAMQLFRSSGLMRVALPESAGFDDVSWNTMLAVFERLREPNFATALAVAIRWLCVRESVDDTKALASRICRRWRLSNEEISTVVALLTNEHDIRNAAAIPWPQLQRILTGPYVESLLVYGAAIAEVLDGDSAAVQHCRSRLALSIEELNPPPLLTGNDLKQLGLSPGPSFKALLAALRDAQLDKLIHTRDDAIDFARRFTSAS